MPVAQYKDILTHATYGKAEVGVMLKKNIIFIFVLIILIIVVILKYTAPAPAALVNASNTNLISTTHASTGGVTLSAPASTLPQAACVAQVKPPTVSASNLTNVAQPMLTQPSTMQVTTESGYNAITMPLALNPTPINYTTKCPNQSFNRCNYKTTKPAATDCSADTDCLGFLEIPTLPPNLPYYMLVNSAIAANKPLVGAENTTFYKKI